MRNMPPFAPHAAHLFIGLGLFLLAYAKERASVVRGTIELFLAPILPRLQVESVDLHGKRAVVTGANTGIGFEVARQLAAMGAEVWLLCRSKEKANKAVDDIKKLTGNLNVYSDIVDFSSLQRVRDVMERWGARSKDDRRVDILVNNAGIASGAKHTTKEGFEETYVVNFLSQFLMTSIMLNRGDFASDARIVQVTSHGQYQSDRVNPNDLNSTDMLGGYKEGDKFGFGFFFLLKLYGRTKAQQTFWTRMLQERLNKSSRYSEAAVSSCHPGAVWTPIWNRSDGIGSLNIITRKLVSILHAFCINSEEGAKTPVYLAVAPQLRHRELRGRYWDRCTWRWGPAWLEDKELGRQLWRRWEEDAQIEVHDL